VKTIGIDLALKNTGIAVCDTNNNILFVDSFSVGNATTANQLVDRTVEWVQKCEQALEKAFHFTRSKGSSEQVYLAYESRPFVMAKSKDGRQSARSVLSYGESLAMLRIAIGRALLKPEETIKLTIGAISPNKWQKQLTDGLPVTNEKIRQAENKLKTNGTKKSQLAAKAIVLATIFERSGVWCKNDHEADAVGIAMVVADSLSHYGDQYGWEFIATEK
jgi:Holliday junction resolvasome RuvABC endonuclease subunit